MPSFLILFMQFLIPRYPDHQQSEERVPRLFGGHEPAEHTVDGQENGYDVDG
jgi:hypothetical protein